MRREGFDYPGGAGWPLPGILILVGLLVVLAGAVWSR